MTSELPHCSRGEIWLLDWNPRRGSEPGVRAGLRLALTRGSKGGPREQSEQAVPPYEAGGFRPGIIVQSDLGNHAIGARTTIMVPLTTQGRAYAFYVPVPKAKENGLPADSWANATQVFTVDKSRLAKRLGKATPAQMKALAVVVTAVFDL